MRSFRNVAILLAGLLLVGCGGSDDGSPRLETVPVAGTVMLDGSAFGPGTIEFIPAEGEGGKTRVASGLVTAEGTFVLGSYDEEDGAVPGSYIVRIAKDASTDPGAAMGTPVEETKVTVPAEGAESLTVDLKSAKGGSGSLLSPKLETGNDGTAIPATL